MSVDVTTDKRVLDREAYKHRDLIGRLIREFLQIHDNLKEQAVELMERKREMSDSIYGRKWGC